MYGEKFKAKIIAFYTKKLLLQKISLPKFLSLYGPLVCIILFTKIFHTVSANAGVMGLIIRAMEDVVFSWGKL